MPILRNLQQKYWNTSWHTEHRSLFPKQNYWHNIKPSEIEKKKKYSTGSELQWASSGCELFKLVHFASQHVIVVFRTGSLGVQIKRQLVVFLCQLELPPAMIKHSWWKTERFAIRLQRYVSTHAPTVCIQNDSFGSEVSGLLSARYVRVQWLQLLT